MEVLGINSYYLNDNVTAAKADTWEISEIPYALAWPLWKQIGGKDGPGVWSSSSLLMCFMFLMQQQFNIGRVDGTPFIDWLIKKSY